MAVADNDSITVIDVRAIPRAERHPRIFGQLESLTEGSSFMLMNDHDPDPLHYQLEVKYPGMFTWEYLEQGPETWRVQIGRRVQSGCGCCCGED